MIQDINIWDIGVEKSLRAEIDSYVIAEFSSMKLKSTQKDPLVGLLFGKHEKELLTINGIAMFGTFSQLSHAIRDKQIEPFLRHFERVWNGQYVGFAIEASENKMNEEVATLTANLYSFRTSVHVDLKLKWNEAKESFDLCLESPLPNKYFRNIFATFYKIPFEVKTFDSNLAGNFISSEKSFRCRARDKTG